MVSSKLKINTNLVILPFGHAIVEVKGGQGVQEIKAGPADYHEPETTNIEAIEITFGGADYGVPKTTGGLL